MCKYREVESLRGSLQRRREARLQIGELSMLKIVRSKDIQLSDSEFNKYEVEYNLMFPRLEDEDALVIQSNDKNFIAVQREGQDMAIWISPELDEDNVSNYLGEFYELIKDRHIPSITGYKAITERVAMKLSRDRDYEYKQAMDMIAYYCPKVNYVDEDCVSLIKGTLSHVDIAAKFFKGFVKDAYGMEVTEKEQVESANSIIKAGNVYLLDKDGEIVSMANIAHRSKKYGRINSVYTPLEHRNNGYASAIVAKISMMLVNEGRIPMLYTDGSNNTSNKVYTNIGFCETGRVNNIKFIDKSE